MTTDKRRQALERKEGPEEHLSHLWTPLVLPSLVKIRQLQSPGILSFFPSELGSFWKP